MDKLPSLSCTPSTGRPNYRIATLRLCASLGRKGLDCRALLQSLGISPLPEDLQASVSGQQMVILLNAASKALGDEFYGLTERGIKPGTFNFLIETGLRCGTLEALIDHAARFLEIVSDDLRVTLSRQGEDAALCLRLRKPELDVDHFLMDHLLLFLHRVLSWCVGYLIPVTRLDLRLGEPPTPDRLCYWLCNHWHAAQGMDVLHFNSRWLTLPLVRTPLEWRAQLEKGAQGQPQWPQAQQRWSIRLQAVLRADLQQGRKPSNLEASAEHLGLRSHKLRRFLGEESSSYQQILDDLRRDVAIEKLHLQHLSLATVADQLGYAETRSFSRAFKQWTGVSPRQYTVRVVVSPTPHSSN